MSNPKRFLALICAALLITALPAMAQLIDSPAELEKKAFARSSAEDLAKDKQMERDQEELRKKAERVVKESESLETPEAEAARHDDVLQAWDVFTEGCLRHGPTLSKWAAQFNALKPAAINSEDLGGMGKSLGYPANDMTLAAWSLQDSQTMLLLQEREGCTVSLNEFIPLSRLGAMVTELADSIEKGTKTKTRVEKKDGTDGQYMMLIKSPPKTGNDTTTAKDGSRPRTENIYMLFVTAPESKNNVRTVMHKFLSSEDFRL